MRKIVVIMILYRFTVSFINYKKIRSGNCESNGMKGISTLEQCEEAARELGFCFYQGVDNYQGNQYPHGCTYNEECGELTYDSPTGSYDLNLDCGIRFEDTYLIECICFSISKY